MNSPSAASLDADIAAAEADLKAITNERDAAVADAKRRIHEEFAERIAAAASRKASAATAKRDFVDSNAGHPWEGRKVWRMDRKPESRWSRKFRDVKIVGIVEVRRTGTVLPGNMAWNVPRHGEAFVRLCKANGDVGVSIDKHRPDARERPFSEEQGGLIWSLVEDEGKEGHDETN